MYIILLMFRKELFEKYISRKQVLDIPVIVSEIVLFLVNRSK